MLERHRRFLPVSVVVVYVVAGMVWIFASGPVADEVTAVTSIPRWSLEFGKGVLFVAVTAVVLQVVMRRRADRLVAMAADAREDAGRLSESEARNHLQATALSYTANAVVITGRDGTIEWVNDAFETMSGYPSSVAVGATPRLLKSGVQDDGFYRELWETVLAGRVWHGQVVNRRSDGELYTVNQTITPVVAENGEIEHLVAIHEDVTERARAARELETSRTRLQALFDHALDAIILADDHGHYIEVNPAVCELTGYSRDELLGMRAADLAAPDQQPADVANQFEQFVQAGAEAGTFALRHKDGHVVETEYRAVANIESGVHLSVLRDVTARNRLVRGLTVAERATRRRIVTVPEALAGMPVCQRPRHPLIRGHSIRHVQRPSSRLRSAWMRPLPATTSTRTRSSPGRPVSCSTSNRAMRPRVWCCVSSTGWGAGRHRHAWPMGMHCRWM